MTRTDDGSFVYSKPRQFQRVKHRVGCEYGVQGEVHQGITLDLSARGVFIQSSIQPEEGEEIELVLREPGFAEILLRGRVAHVQLSHRSVIAAAAGGFGVQLEAARENFFQLLVRLGLG